MSTSTLTRLRHGLLVLIAATILAVTTAMAPAVLDKIADTNLTTTVFACGAPSGGC